MDRPLSSFFAGEVENFLELRSLIFGESRGYLYSTNEFCETLGLVLVSVLVMNFFLETNDRGKTMKSLRCTWSLCASKFAKHEEEEEVL